MTIRAITGEVGRYFVQSGSQPEGEHLVDLLEHECGCADYVCRRRAHEIKTGHKYVCRHLFAVRNHFLDEILEAIRTEQLSR